MWKKGNNGVPRALPFDAEQSVQLGNGMEGMDECQQLPDPLVLPRR